jgi:hypothetical protein
MINMAETLVDQVDKLSEIFDYIADKSNDDEAGNIISILGLDNPHIAITKSKEDFKRLADKLLAVRKFIK